MARPSSNPGKQADIKSIIIPPGMTVEGEITLKPAESLVERRARLRQEFLSFLVKDLLAYLVAFGLIVFAALYGFLVLLRRGETLEIAVGRCRSSARS